jgi:hypothetical protein
MSHSSLLNTSIIPKTAWDSLGGVQILHDFIICEETASKCLPYASSGPTSISEFQRQAGFWNMMVLKCWFLMSPSDIEIKLNILVAHSKF